MKLELTAHLERATADLQAGNEDLRGFVLRLARIGLLNVFN